MSFWAFTKGATKTLREELTRQQVAEEERLEWERRLAFQMKLQEQVEKARHAREKAVSGYDSKSGKFFEITRDGQRSEYEAPPGYVDEYNETKKREQAKLDREIRNEEADNRRADAQLAVSSGYLSANREQQQYQRERDRVKDMADLAKSGLGYGAGGGVFPVGQGATETPSENTAVGQVQRLYQTIAAPDSPYSEDIKAAAAAVMSSQGSYNEKLAALNQLEKNRFGTPPAPGGSSPYPEGTRLKGPDGIYVVRNGVPVKE